MTPKIPKDNSVNVCSPRGEAAGKARQAAAFRTFVSKARMVLLIARQDYLLVPNIQSIYVMGNMES